MKQQIRSEEPISYTTNQIDVDIPQAPRIFHSDDEVIAAALNILDARSRAGEVVISSPGHVIDWLRLKFAPLPHEVFSVLWTDQRSRPIHLSEIFRGSVSGSGIYPREVAKEALKYNAVGAVLVHNHPSGAVGPSSADMEVTTRLKDALDLMDVQVLDHIIVGLDGHFSFKNAGLI